MRLCLRLAFLSATLLAPLYCQSQRDSSQYEEAEAEKLAGWKWINFGLLVAGLGYFAARKGPAFFNARSEQIRKAIEDATGLKVDADFRSSEIDRRMATLGQEIQRLREESKAGLEREGKRIDDETRAALDRMQEHTTREINSLRRQAEGALREHAVRLAADLAVAHLRDNPKQIEQDNLVRIFASDILAERRSS